MSTFDQDRFVEEIQNANGDGGQGAVEQVIKRAVSNPREMIAAFGEPKTGGIQTLYRSESLSIMNIVWGPHMILYPHDHNMWVSIGLYTGREDNIVWNPKGNLIEAAGAASLSEKDIYSLPKTAIHSVINPIPRLTGAIHVYGGDFFSNSGRSQWDPGTLKREPFDIENVKSAFKEANRL